MSMGLHMVYDYDPQGNLQTMWETSDGMRFNTMEAATAYADSKSGGGGGGGVPLGSRVTTPLTGDLPAGSAGGNIATGTSAAGATAPGATSAASSGPFAALKNPTVLGTIVSGLGTLVNAIQTNKATNAQEKQAADALALQARMYDTTREDLRPYREAGSAAERYRGYLLGLPGYDTPSSGAQPVTEAGTQTVNIPGVGQVRQNQIIRNPDGSIKQINGSIVSRDTSGSMPVTPEGQRPAGMKPYGFSGSLAAGVTQPGTLSSLSQMAPSQSQMVSVKSPTGHVGQIPANRLQDALAAGGTQV
jgi:hypothetical protein